MKKMNFQFSEKTDMKKGLLIVDAQLTISLRSVDAQLTISRSKKATSQNALQAP